MANALTAAFLGVSYLALFLLEHALPLRRAKRSLPARLFANLAVTAAAFLTAAALVRPVTGATLDLTASTEFGLMRFAGFSGALELVAAFLLLDLSFYYWHVANHRIAFLWRFHNVHHIDPDLDVSTAFRFHFVEVALSAGFRAVQVIVIGPSVFAYLVYEVAFELGTLFHHSNLRLPLVIERNLNRIVVTPRMHGIHHSDIREENISNFGVVFPWWDRLHRTLRLERSAEPPLVIGLPAYRTPLGAVRLLTLPFTRQPATWPRAT